jgi:hypothetical protein
MQLVLVGGVMGCSYLFAGHPVACWAKIMTVKSVTGDAARVPQV